MATTPTKGPVISDFGPVHKITDLTVPLKKNYKNLSSKLVEL
jgi:hypothetical protein